MTNLLEKTVYVGMFEKGEKSGEGKMFTSNGEAVEGIAVDNVLISHERLGAADKVGKLHKPIQRKLLKKKKEAIEAGEREKLL